MYDSKGLIIHTVLFPIPALWVLKNNQRLIKELSVALWRGENNIFFHLKFGIVNTDFQQSTG